MRFIRSVAFVGGENNEALTSHCQARTSPVLDPLGIQAPTPSSDAGADAPGLCRHSATGPTLCLYGDKRTLTTKPNPWGPYPVGFEKLCRLFTQAGMEHVEKLATRPSLFGGTMYSALAERSRA